MKPKARFLTIAVLTFFPVLPSQLTGQPARTTLTKNEYTVLKVCEGVVQLFRRSSEAVWPGYNLARTPFVVYLPSKWALLLNTPQPVNDFAEAPENWPSVGAPVRYHQGQYKDLIGQLVFDFQVDTVKTVAIGVSEEYLNTFTRPEIWLFGFCVHEAFHQYQSEQFGEIPWEREERYPILDSQNTSLACIEMRLLADALRMMQSGDDGKCRDVLSQFVAVRDQRWHNANEYVARYEQGQEIREGTARYVEMKSVALMKSLEYRSRLTGLTSSLQSDFAAASFPDILISDLYDRMAGNSIQPENMLRNRIYPVGSAMGFLLDHFHINWKARAQLAGPRFAFHQVLAESLGLEAGRYDELVERAKKAHDYPRISCCTDSLIADYLEGYKKDLASFESQAGHRIQIDFTARSLSRSRSSSGKKWLVDDGSRSLCNNYLVYSLKNSDMLLQIQKSAVSEVIDWDAKKYLVTLFVPELPALSVDGEAISWKGLRNRSFNNAEVSGETLKFRYSKTGKITVTGNRITIVLN